MTITYLASTSLGKENIEILVARGEGRILSSIRADVVLMAIEFPAGVSDLDTGLTNVDRNDFTHCYILASCCSCSA